jgi:hypothetical protein
LRGLGVGAVDKDDRRQRVSQREAAELLRINPPVIVVRDDAVHHDQHAERIGLLDKGAQSLDPGPHPASFLDIEVKGVPDPRGCDLNAAFQGCGAHELERRSMFGSRKLAIPLLTLLAEVDRVQKVRAWLFNPPTCDGPKIGDRHLLDRRLVQEEIPKRSARRAGIFL